MGSAGHCAAELIAVIKTPIYSRDMAYIIISKVNKQILQLDVRAADTGFSYSLRGRTPFDVSEMGLCIV